MHHVNCCRNAPYKRRCKCKALCRLPDHRQVGSFSQGRRLLMLLLSRMDSTAPTNSTFPLTYVGRYVYSSPLTGPTSTVSTPPAMQCLSTLTSASPLQRARAYPSTTSVFYPERSWIPCTTLDLGGNSMPKKRRGSPPPLPGLIGSDSGSAWCGSNLQGSSWSASCCVSLILPLLFGHAPCFALLCLDNMSWYLFCFCFALWHLNWIALPSDAVASFSPS